MGLFKVFFPPFLGLFFPFFLKKKQIRVCLEEEGVEKKVVGIFVF